MTGTCSGSWVGCDDWATEDMHVPKSWDETIYLAT